MERGEFGGTIGRWYWESEQWWPEEQRPPASAPNVVVMLLDDVGFAQIGPYGSDIDTPTFDRLAADGLSFTNFHTTALCSPTRACVLTGRNHHTVGMGRIIDLATGFPGYDAHISRAHGFLPEMLGPSGWAGYAVGKWHLTPRDLHHLGADRSTWPLGRGFDRYYGFFDGETHQFAPSLIHDNHQVEPPGDYASGYHFTADITDRAIEWISDLRNADPDKPFFLYYTPGACHSPHHAPANYVEDYRGRFDEGWDVWREHCHERQLDLGVIPPTTELSARPGWVPAWAELSHDEQRVAARYMEAFAAMLTHTDAQIGRFVDFLESTGDLDNTLLLLLSDNGASSEGQAGGSLNDVRSWNGLGSSTREALERLDEIGGPSVHNNYPFGWTMAGNTPFRRWKREVHEGGIADPLIVHWPAGVAGRGELRHQYCHAIDLAPTILEACGVAAPPALGGVEQSPIEGTSLLGVLGDRDHPEVRTTQYYEMLGCRAIYHEGYKAVSYHPIQVEAPGLDTVPWELYDVRVDPSECHDLAADESELLAEMIAMWWDEAAAHNVFPVDNRPFSDFTLARPRSAPEQPVTVLRPSSAMIPEACAPDTKNRTHTITATIEVGDGGAVGVLASQGSGLGGWVLYCSGDSVTWHLNVSTKVRTVVSGPADLGPGSHIVELHFDKTSEVQGEAAISVDGLAVAAGEVSYNHVTRISMTGAGLSIGRADAYPVCADPHAGTPFAGTIDSVVIEFEGPSGVDQLAELAKAVDAQ
jgi:arylsulfatase A-like enzyme